MEWWGGDGEGIVSDPRPGYAAYFATIRHELPADLLAREESISLHDTRLRELRISRNDGTLRLGLETHSGDERLTLVYREVERFESLADPKVGLRGPAGYGDLGYCEVEVLPGGTFEHRMLFSTGIELIVEFREFEMTRTHLAKPGAA